MAAKENKPARPPKFYRAPGFYKKSLTKDVLLKKYLKYLEQGGDKKFIQSCYTESGDNFSIRQDLSKEEVKRLAVLKKEINANRKMAVKLLPLGILAVIVAGSVVFFTIFANPIIQKAFETGMEMIFEARVNANRFRVSLVKFEIAMDSLTIADRDAPMQNLIQFSAMRIKLKPAAVLRGKIYIEEIRADNIRFGTARTVSGALPGIASKQQAEKEEVTIPPLVDLANFDPMALLNQEYDKLQTPKLYDASIQAYETASAKWKGEQASTKARIGELQARAEPLLKINVNDYRTLDENTIRQITTVIGEVNDLVNTVQAAQGDVNRMVSGVQQDINTAVALERSARNAFTADFAHLRSFIDLGSGAAMEVLEPVVRSILTDSAQTYIAYGARALELLEQVKVLQAKLPKSEEKPPKKEVIKGRDVIFPMVQYPKFFLGILATDVLTPGEWLWGLDLRGVSSAPDISNVPTTLALSLEEADAYNRTGIFSGQADFRSGARERFNAALSGSGFPVNIRAGLDKIGVEGFSGGASFKLNASGRTDGGFNAGGDMSFVQAKLTNPTNTFTQAADEAIRQVGSVDLGLQYEHVISGKDKFSLTTNFTNILRDALARIVSRYRTQAEEALEKALRAKIDQYIDGRFVGKEELDLVFAALRGDKSAVDGLKGSLDAKKAELENRLRGAATQVVDEVRQQSQQAVQDVIQGQRPQVPTLPPVSIPTPTLPRR